MDILQSKSEVAEAAGNLIAEKIGDAQSVKTPRLDSVDLLRGLVMILMALDHVRWPYFTNAPFGPENLDGCQDTFTK